MSFREYQWWVAFLSQESYNIDTKEHRLLMSIAREVRQTRSQSAVNLDDLKLQIAVQQVPQTKAEGLAAVKSQFFAWANIPIENQ